MKEKKNSQRHVVKGLEVSKPARIIIYSKGSNI